VSELQRLWSVTSLIKTGLGTSDALVGWVGRTVAEYAVDNVDAWSALAKADRDGAVKLLVDSRYRKSGVAMARGSDLHGAAEMLALGQEPDVPIEIVPYVEQYRRFLEDHEPGFVMAEAPVYSPSYFFAGTLDGIAEIGGRRVVFDVKSTDRGPDSEKMRPPYPEAALQLCAYRHAEWVGVLSEQRYASGKRYYLFDPEAQHEPMPETDGAVVVVISPYDYRVIPVRTDEAVWRAFLQVRECARWQMETSKGVFGPPITAPLRGAA
jgi:hypothetical protein